MLCDAAAERAAAATGVPVSVLKAIALTETGRKSGGRFRPWPWTVNMEGKGVWFDDPQSARDFIDDNYRRGARSFDVGCFQLNYRWHGRNFASIDEMMEPGQNALYAANFLLELFRETGDWDAAAGAYHSRTRKLADRYKSRFRGFRAALVAEDVAPPLSALKMAATAPDRPAAPAGTTASAAPAPPRQRINRYPLLQPGRASGALGSLVPVAAARGPGLFSRSGAGG